MVVNSVVTGKTTYGGTWALLLVLTLTWCATSLPASRGPASSPIKGETRSFPWSLSSVVLEFSSALIATLPEVQCDPRTAAWWLSLFPVSVLQITYQDCGCGLHGAVEGSLQRGYLPGVIPDQLPGFVGSALWYPKTAPLTHTHANVGGWHGSSARSSC